MPVLVGFNSGSYGLNLIKEHFPEWLADTTDKVQVGKKRKHDNVHEGRRLPLPCNYQLSRTGVFPPNSGSPNRTLLSFQKLVTSRLWHTCEQVPVTARWLLVSYAVCDLNFLASGSLNRNWLFLIYQWRKVCKRNLKSDAYTFFSLNDLTLILTLQLVPLSYFFFHVLVSKRSWVAGSDQFCYTHCKLALF